MLNFLQCLLTSVHENAHDYYKILTVSPKKTNERRKSMKDAKKIA